MREFRFAALLLRTIDCDLARIANHGSEFIPALAVESNKSNPSNGKCFGGAAG